MAVNKWVGLSNGKWATGTNWSGGTPNNAAECQMLAAKNEPCEINPTAGKCRSLEFEAGYTAKITNSATGLVRIGHPTVGTGTALKLTTEVTWEVNSNLIFEFEAGATGKTEKITSAGKTLPTLVFLGESGVWQLADALTAASIGVTRGTWETGNQTVTTNGNFEITGVLVRTVKLGSSLVKIVGTLWDASTTTNLTFSAETSTIELAGTSSAKEFRGGGLPYNNLTDAHLAGETKITGANTFATIAVNNKEATAKKGCKFESKVAQTITGLTSNGASGKLARIESTVEGERHKLKKAAGNVELKFTYIQDSEAEGGVTWTAGEGCVDGGNNVGWTFEGAVTTIAGVAKIKIKQANATEVLYSAAGTTKATIKTTNATTSSYSVQSAAKVRFNTAGALSNKVALAGATKVTFTDSLFVKVTKEGEEGRKVVFLIVDE